MFADHCYGRCYTLSKEGWDAEGAGERGSLSRTVWCSEKGTRLQGCTPLESSLPLLLTSFGFFLLLNGENYQTRVEV